MNDKHRKKDAIKKQAKQIEGQFGLLGSPWERAIDGLIDIFAGDDSEEEQEESNDSSFDTFDTGFDTVDDDDDSSGFGGGDDGGGGSSDDW